MAKKYRITLLAAAALIFFSVQVRAVALTDETRSVTTLATVPLGVLFNDNSYTAVATFRGTTYFVWINSDDRPKVGMLKNGVFTSAYLSPITTYTIRNDGHHYFSLGVDNDGYIHVTGDMHNYPAADMTLYPEEYKSKIIMYWVSKQPESIDFEFVGGNAARAVPGYGFGYHSFQYDQDRNLYFLARIKVHKGGHKPGEMGLGLFKYSTATKSWAALGGYAPSSPAAIYKSIAWEVGGDAGTGGWYQGFRASVRFDLNNRMHYAAAIWKDSLQAGNPTHVIFAQSDDKGITYRKSDGTVINAPARVSAGTSQGDIVAGPGKFDLFASVAFNRFGDPLAGYSEVRDRPYFSYKYRPTGQNWSAQVQDPFNTYIRAKYHLDSWGMLTLMTPSGQYRRLNDFNSAGYNSNVNADYSFVCVDELGLRENGDFIGISKAPGVVNLVRLRITPNMAALPSAFTLSQIGSVSSQVSGTYNGVLSLGNASSGASAASDSLGFAYQLISGDFDMRVRVISLGWSSDAAQAGILIRQDNSAGAKMAAAAITYNQGAKFMSRGTAAAAAETAVKSGHTAAEWLRLVRQGSTISAYRSDNGNSWDIIGNKNVSFTGSVQAGFFYSSASAAAGRANFDNFSISVSAYSPTPNATATFTASATRTFTQTATNTSAPPTFTYTKTSTALPPTQTYTRTFTATGTNTAVPPTYTYTITYTPTSSNTLVPPTRTLTRTFTPTDTSTAVPITQTSTYTNTATSTNTAVPPTATFTLTHTFTGTFTLTHTNTYTPVFTDTHTSTLTFTITQTSTVQPSFTYTATIMPSFTSTYTPVEGTKQEINNIFVYPNPYSQKGNLRIKFFLNKKSSIKFCLYSASFRRIKEINTGTLFENNDNIMELDRKHFSGLANGTYYFILGDDKGKKSGIETLILMK